MIRACSRPSFATEQLPGDSSVVGFLLVETSPPVVMPLLDDPHFRERQSHRSRPLGGDLTAVERALVGVEGEEGGGLVGLRDLLLDHHAHSSRLDVNLLDLVPGVGENRPVVVREGEDEGTPLPGRRKSRTLPVIESRWNVRCVAMRKG